MNYPVSFRTVLGLLIGALLFFAAQKLFAQSEAPLLRVRIEAENVFDVSAELEAAGYDVVSESTKDFTVDVVVSEAELETLQTLGLRIIEIKRGQPLRDIVPIDDGSSDLRAGYLDLAGINARMREVAAAFPDIAQVVNLTETYNAPPTVEGRSLFAVKISDNVNAEEDEPAVMIVSNHHAREVVTPVIALDAIDRLTQGYGTDQQITDAVNNNEIWIAPTWNPDGYNHVVVADNLWRKNRRVFSRGIGVDQNRNYPQGWSTSCSGSTNPSSNTFKGDAPASEAETKTMIAWSRDQRFAKVIDYHSRGREVVYGYSCPPRHPFRNFMRTQGAALSRASSYPVQPRSPSADGEHYQWQLAEMGAWSYLVETAQEFQPSFNSAKQESDRVWPGILFALENPISLSGHVTDAQTGGPLEATIEFLNVNFRNNETYGSGGPFGRYHASLPARTYQVRFSATGYQSEERSVTIDSNTSAEVLDIQLQREGSVLPSVSVTASDAAAAEAGLNPGAFSITRNGGDINATLTVQYSIAGSATAGSDYQTLSGSTTIAAGQSTSIVTVTPIDDNEVENDESVVLSLPPNAGYTVDTPSIATVVIASDDEVEPFGADLVVAAFTGTPTSLNTGELLNYSVQALNQGNSPARANFVRLVLSTDSVIDGNDRRLTRPSPRVAALASGASATLTGQLTLPADVAPGNYFLGAIVDPSNRVTENNETNNTSTVPITVTAVTGTSPDLVISLTTTSNSVIPGAGLNYAVAALNQGTAQAGNNFARLVLSRDATIDRNDLRLTRPSLRVPALAAGTSYPDSGTVTIPPNTVPGIYFLGAIVDPSSRVNESDENNNSSNGVAITVISTLPAPAR